MNKKGDRNGDRNGEQEIIAYLRNPATIRTRAKILYDYVAAGHSKFFTLNLDKLPEVVAYVLQETDTNYPDGNIPYHSRWRHFDAGKKKGEPSRIEAFYQDAANQSSAYQRSAFQGAVYQPDLPPHIAEQENELEALRQAVELTIISVLLDAGAGMAWTFRPPDSATVLSKSEGLAVAAYFMMKSGIFSQNPHSPWQCHSDKLMAISQDTLEHYFQVSATNPLVGCHGRTALLHKLGEVLQQDSEFQQENECRLGFFADVLVARIQQSTLQAGDVLACVLDKFSSIWPSRITIAGNNLGDVWHHEALLEHAPAPGMIPFHKLSQWLSYSLLEPLEKYGAKAGLKVTGQDQLTGLPEYRNGGLFIDFNVIQFKDPALASQPYRAEDKLIVEWRALTVHLLDEVGSLIRKHRRQTPQELPLVKVLQGGTWSAGRRIAKARRADGGSPVNIISDGTIF